ncbi:ATPase [Metabacillus herbersteinensis]|uniref:ATPase n=1 Tax=Metabacillus herbersteinensis TaxID=283816 RepID=A0ABV6GDM5_9BACI
MRDVLFLPLHSTHELVVATDCTGGVGLKEQDCVKVDYKTLSYFSARVALMECLSVGAEAKAVILQNFISDDVWEELCEGINKACSQLKLDPLEITGSTETNFSMSQSSLGLSVLGWIEKGKRRINVTPKGANLAIIGKPLVGEEVIRHSEHVISLQLFHKLINNPSIYEMIPVGSKGVRYEAQKLLHALDLTHLNLISELDLEKSSGPSTCVLISYDGSKEQSLRNLVGSQFYEIHISDLTG